MGSADDEPVSELVRTLTGDQREDLEAIVAWYEREQHEFEALYGPGLAAAARGGLDAPAPPSESFDTED